MQDVDEPPMLKIDLARIPTSVTQTLSVAVDISHPLLAYLDASSVATASFLLGSVSPCEASRTNRSMAAARPSVQRPIG